MFTMDEDYVQARFAMIGARYGLGTMLRPLSPGQKIATWTAEQLEAEEHDELLIKNAFVGEDTGRVVELFEQLRPKLRSPLRAATVEDIRSYFDCPEPYE